MTDWTIDYDQNDIAKHTNQIVDDIIQNIFKNSIELHTVHRLSYFETSLLYRWPIYVGANLFIERLLRVSHMQKNEVYPLTDQENIYFNNSVKSVQAYYYNFSLNYSLLGKLFNIISGQTSKPQSKKKHKTKPQNQLGQAKSSIYSIKKVLKRAFLFTEKKYISFIKPAVIGEHSGWFRKLWFFGHGIDYYSHDFRDQDKQLDKDSRAQLKSIFVSVFIKHVSHIFKTLKPNQIRQCAEVFSDWIDHILPVSLIEGLQPRFDYYRSMLETWEIKQVHSFTGYNYNDSFKVFSILAKRKGAELIGHTHGANNYISNSYKGSNELRLLDHYTTYGVNITDNNLNNPGAKRVNFIPTGSTSFKAVEKWLKTSISINNISLLYPSGPLMDFMGDLQEISPEKNIAHRLKILAFIDKLLKKYPGLKIIYKPFPGTYTNDPIKKHYKHYFDEGRIKLTNKKPKGLYPKVDMVLWDSVSTGFAESVVADVPVIVFNSKHEYEQTSNRGRIVNDALKNSGVQCFDICSAIKSFKRIINDLDSYKKDTLTSINMFKKDMATPVTRKEWHDRFNNGISSE